MNRRRILRGSLEALFWATAVDLLHKPIENGLEAIWQRFRGFTPREDVRVSEAQRSAECAVLLNRLIGHQPGRLMKLAGGRDHYLYPNRMHPDNELALNVMTNILHNQEEPFQRDDNGDFSPDGSFVCFGGPIANLRTASFLGYQRVDPRNPRLGFREIESSPLKLAIKFELDSERLAKLGLLSQMRVHHERTPEWAIKIGPAEDILESKAGEVDYLLVSRLPNWIKVDRQRQFTDIVTVFAGCHGAGMGAFRLLAGNLALLAKLDELTRYHQFWQALIRIRTIDAGLHPITGTMRDEAVNLEPDLVAHFPVII